MHVHSCSFANINRLLFCRSRCRHCRLCFLLHIVVIYIFCYHGNMMSFYFSLLTFCFLWLTATNSPEAMMESDDDYNFDSDFSWWKTPPHLKGHLMLDMQQTRFQDDILIVCFNHLFHPHWPWKCIFVKNKNNIMAWRSRLKHREADGCNMDPSLRDSAIGHLLVPKTLTFKVRLSAQHFSWKWVLFAWERKIISMSKAEHLTSFWYRGPGELGKYCHWDQVVTEEARFF